MAIDCIHASRASFCVYWLAGALFVSVAVLGFAPSALPGSDWGTVALLAPMGASVTLMLIKPKSGFARPSVVLIANTLATGIGLLVPHILASVIFGSAAAVALTMAAMGALRTIHPPSAGLALLAVSHGAQPFSQSLSFLLEGVVSRTVILIILAIGLNRLASAFFREPASTQPIGESRLP